LIVRLRVEALPENDRTNPTLLLPEGLRESGKRILSVGLAEEEVALGPRSMSKGELGLFTRNPGLVTLNGAAASCRLDDQRVRVGPIFGVFINSHQLASITSGRVNFRTAELAKAAEREHVITYYFSADGVNFDHRWAYGVRVGASVPAMYPLPDVIWDKCTPTSADGDLAQVVRDRFALLPVHLLNPVSQFNKWDLYTRLLKYPDVAGSLPATALYTGVGSVTDMLAAYGSIYAKAVVGSNGRQVMRLARERAIHYATFRGKLQIGCIKSSRDVRALFNRFFGNCPVIIQQAIPVRTFRGRATDLRALIQRDETGAARLTAMPLRIASKGSPVTSTASGSTVMPFLAGMVQAYGLSLDEAHELKGRLESYLLKVVQAVEKEYGTFCELGIDVGVDDEGDFWMFECNAKPGKDTVIKAGVESEIESAFSNPLRYAQYITGFRR
jgi:hypothetical protein